MQGLTFDIAVERLLDLLPLLGMTVLAIIILEPALYLLLTRVFKTKYALPFTLVAPAVVALAIFTVYPFVFNIQLAFSDLRLKTISCYISEENITNAPCSLGQAALNADANINLDEIPVRAEPSETAEVAFTLQDGDEVRVTGRSKAVGYTALTGFATSETGTVCNPLDAACVQRQREAEAALKVQDERYWWEIKTSSGQVGWIPDVTFFMSGDADVYAESAAAGDILGSVISGEQVRLVKRESEMWYQIETADGTIGWVIAEPRKVNLYIPAETLTLYDDQSTDSEVVGEISAAQEVNMLRDQPLTWYEVETGEGTAWINAELRVTELYRPSGDVPLFSEANFLMEQTVTLTADQNARLTSRQTETWYEVSDLSGQRGWVNVQPETVEAFEIQEPQDILSAAEGTDIQVLGSVEAGELVVNLSSTTVEDTIWYFIQTDQNVTGWVKATPEAFTDIVIVSETTAMIANLESNLVIATLPGGTQVEEFDSSELTWYELRLEDGTSGFTNSEPDSIIEQYAAPAEISAYAAFNDTSNVVTTIAEDTEINILSTQDAPWYQIQTRDEARLLGWVNADPAEVRTIFTNSEDGPLHAEPSHLAETLAEIQSGDTVQVKDDQLRYWHQIRTETGIVGWVEAVPKERVTTDREIVLYSLEYGWNNLKQVFVDEDPETGEILGWGRLLQTENSTFPRLMRTTLIWTSFNVIFHLLFGMILALILNQKGLKGTGIYRAIIVLPWAIPQVIIALAWRGEFNFQFGFVNALVQELGFEPIQWLFKPTPALVAVTFVNIWLGVPFYVVTLLGGLQSIAPDYYEAASMDGANSFQRFKNITVPLIRPVAVPIVTLDVIWTFNNFNVIFLITGGEPNESTNILVTALYNAAFGPNGQFRLGFASAFSLVIFVVLILFASVWITQSGALKGIYEK